MAKRNCGGSFSRVEGGPGRTPNNWPLAYLINLTQHVTWIRLVTTRTSHVSDTCYPEAPLPHCSSPRFLLLCILRIPSHVTRILVPFESIPSVFLIRLHSILVFENSQQCPPWVIRCAARQMRSKEPRSMLRPTGPCSRTA